MMNKDNDEGNYIDNIMIPDEGNNNDATRGNDEDQDTDNGINTNNC